MKQALIALIAIATLASAPGLAQPGGPDHGHADGIARMAKTLGLTAEQQQQAKAIRERHRALVKSDWLALQAKQKELSALLRSPGATVDQAVAKQREIDALKAKLAENRLRGWFETRALLTPEQLQKLKQLKPMHREHDEW